MSWIAIITGSLFIIGMVIFIIIRNQKDKHELEQKINNDYPKKRDDEGDIVIEE